MGGHIVQGHVDGQATLIEVCERGASYELTATIPAELTRYVVEKGSVALDGVSLTVARLAYERITVAVVPHTWQSTTLAERRVGDKLNLEVDIVGKYVERLLGLDGARRGESKLTEAYLREKGF